MLNTFLERLSERQSSDTVFNQYQDADIRNNLKLYLEYLVQNNHGVLMIGQAPGYNGCRLTGIPFTSGDVVRRAQHLIFKEIGGRIRSHRVASEPTATILWEFFGNDKPVPVLWNAFPFYAHERGEPKEDREPTRSEIEEGKVYLKMVHDVFQPKTLCSLGRIGQRILEGVFPGEEIVYIRHPSYGGKKAFIEGMNRLCSLSAMAKEHTR